MTRRAGLLPPFCCTSVRSFRVRRPHPSPRGVHMTRWMGRVAALAVVVSMTLVAVVAQAGEGAKFYAEYSAALTKAKSVDEMLPYLSKMRAARMQKTPESEKTMMLGVIQSLQPKAIKVLKESASGDGIVLEVAGTGEDGPKTGTVTLVREDGKRKLDKESWKS